MFQLNNKHIKWSRLSIIVGILVFLQTVEIGVFIQIGRILTCTFKNSAFINTFWATIY